MARVKIELPEQMDFHTQLPVRIGDINYGGHVGNDAILSIIHEARLRFLANFGYGELDKDGQAGLIMADAALVYKGEGFHGDIFDIAVGADDFTPFGFDLYYRITTVRGDKTILIAEAKSGMIYFDYKTRKVARLPEEWKQTLSPVK
ncbi:MULTISPECIES: thioesterase family protein [unclassified Chitinophaga]|uniref:thioesterase family protein n=1 Tax=unclassified Chitinophaga TaxID=2619133 RepID=UPI0009CC1A09|nr:MULTISPECIES: thioesterase family protein [unclassified Chitinophaga]OMP80607.1 thioesterase [[Flexibacter] sp. ATCC 35208]WPV69485.1 thioesterase family protein [Chitinophaga sp. LS1]